MNASVRSKSSKTSNAAKQIYTCKLVFYSCKFVRYTCKSPLNSTQQSLNLMLISQIWQHVISSIVNLFHFVSFCLWSFCSQNIFLAISSTMVVVLTVNEMTIDKTTVNEINVYETTLCEMTVNGM
jgi:hypothetical protein